MESFAQRLKSNLVAFKDDNDGTLSVETILMMPLLAFILVLMYTFVEIFSYEAALAKASFNISDLISRERVGINQTYIDGLYKVFKYISRTSDKVALRVTFFHYDGAQSKFIFDWSHVSTSGGATALDQAKLDLIAGKIPAMSNNDYAVLVETNMRYTPPFAGNTFKNTIGTLQFNNFIVTRMRFEPKLCWNTNPPC